MVQTNGIECCLVLHYTCYSCIRNECYILVLLLKSFGDTIHDTCYAQLDCKTNVNGVKDLILYILRSPLCCKSNFESSINLI